MAVLSEFLSKLGFGALKSVVLKSKKKLARGYWKILVRFLNECLEKSIPRQLINKENLDIPFPRTAGELLKGYKGFWTTSLGARSCDWASAKGRLR